MNAEERYENFKKEYEELCKKYQMYHDLYDMWDLGHEQIHVYDEKENCYFVD